MRTSWKLLQSCPCNEICTRGSENAALATKRCACHKIKYKALRLPRNLHLEVHPQSNPALTIAVRPWEPLAWPHCYTKSKQSVEVCIITYIYIYRYRQFGSFSCAILSIYLQTIRFRTGCPIWFQAVRSTLQKQAFSRIICSSLIVSKSLNLDTRLAVSRIWSSRWGSIHSRITCTCRIVGGSDFLVATPLIWTQGHVCAPWSKMNALQFHRVFDIAPREISKCALCHLDRKCFRKTKL